MNLNGSDVKRLTFHPADDRNPSWSPDGTRIAFSSRRDGDDNSEIYIMTADGDDLRNLTQHPSLDVEPSWSPDGHTIAFTSSRDGTADIYMMDTDGQNLQQVTHTREFEDYASGPPIWSPDSAQIAFELSKAGQREINILHLASRRQFQLTDGTGLKYVCDWSADGQQILYLSAKRGLVTEARLMVAFPDGRDSQELPLPDWDLSSSGSWSLDSRQFVFCGRKPGSDWEVYLYDTLTNRLTNLTNHPSEDLSPDWHTASLANPSSIVFPFLWAQIKVME